MTRERWIAFFLVALGTAQMVGELAGSPAVRAIAAATGASPAPKVFTTVQGLETFSTRFFLEAANKRIELTPDLYARMRGPYNRRNVYGAAVAYAPVLPSDLRDPVLLHALCGGKPLLTELGIDLPSVDTVTLQLQPRPSAAPPGLEMRFHVSCSASAVTGAR
jgi:hypothetical protein